MSSKNNPSDKQNEIAAEKKITRHPLDPDFAVGENFVEEPTGSATMVNMDGRWDFDHRP